MLSTKINFKHYPSKHYLYNNVFICWIEFIFAWLQLQEEVFLQYLFRDV